MGGAEFTVFLVHHLGHFLKTGFELSSYIFPESGYCGEFPGGPVIRTQHFHCQGPGLIPGQGNKIPQVMQCKKRKRKKKKHIKSMNFEMECFFDTFINFIFSHTFCKLQGILPSE